jgi:hypothetical protein
VATAAAREVEAGAYSLLDLLVLLELLQARPEEHFLTRGEAAGDGSARPRSPLSHPGIAGDGGRELALTISRDAEQRGEDHRGQELGLPCRAQSPAPYPRIKSG